MYNIGPTSAQLNADGKLNLVFSAARRRQGTLLSAVAYCFMTLILSAAAAGAFATGNSGWSLFLQFLNKHLNIFLAKFCMKQAA